MDSVEIDQEEEETGDYGILQREIVLYVLDVYALADETETSSLEIPDGHKFIAAQTAYNKCCLTAKTV